MGARVYRSLGLCIILFGGCAWAQRPGHGPGFRGGGFRSNFGGPRVFRPAAPVRAPSFYGQPFRFSRPDPRRQGFHGWWNGGGQGVFRRGPVPRSPFFASPRPLPFGGQRFFRPAPVPRGPFFGPGPPAFFAGPRFFPHHGTFFFPSHHIFFFPHHRFFFTPLFFDSFFFSRPFFSTFGFGPFFLALPLQPIWISNGLYPSFGCPYDDFYYPRSTQRYSGSATDTGQSDVLPPDDAPQATPGVSDLPTVPEAAASEREASETVQQESVVVPADEDQEPPSPRADEGVVVRSGQHILFITSNRSASFGTTLPKPAPRASPLSH